MKAREQTIGSLDFRNRVALQGGGVATLASVALHFGTKFADGLTVYITANLNLIKASASCSMHGHGSQGK